MIDWASVATFARAGALGPHAAAFGWDHFDPADPYAFVDDMTVNGLLLCKAHHTGKDEGIHDMPFPALDRPEVRAGRLPVHAHGGDPPC